MRIGIERIEKMEEGGKKKTETTKERIMKDSRSK